MCAEEIDNSCLDLKSIVWDLTGEYSNFRAKAVRSARARGGVPQ